MNDVVIFETSILIDELCTGRHRERIQPISALIRTSAVVLAELWRGATQPAEREFLRTLAKNHPVLTPTEKNWLESGAILGGIHAARLCPPQSAQPALRCADCAHGAIRWCPPDHHQSR
jgi:predicted nucleic acid-binding protein